MSRPQRKYAREQVVHADLSQTCFKPDGSIYERAPVQVKDASVDVTQTVFCPFCLQSDKLQVFLISTKKGISKSRGQCPKCQSGMMLHTLLRQWTAESFADFVFNYARQGYWQKIKFEDWKVRLNALGWGPGFWDRYRALKAENPREGEESESYIDRMNRQGEEAAREWADQGVEPGA